MKDTFLYGLQVGILTTMIVMGSLFLICLGIALLIGAALWMGLFLIIAGLCCLLHTKFFLKKTIHRINTATDGK